MKTDEAIRFHSDRAMAELDCALSARCVEAAQAHFGLSALHLGRVEVLKRTRGQGLRQKRSLQAA